MFLEAKQIAEDIPTNDLVVKAQVVLYFLCSEKC